MNRRGPRSIAETFDGHTVQTVQVQTLDGPDAYVVLGVGPAGDFPMAYLRLCPCDGVDGLIADLQLAAAAARPLHLPHAA
jgi:hypothetical protein